MSTASISYKYLKNASNEAETIAKKIDQYADSLYSNVYRKLSKYSGAWTPNIATVSSNINNKISELRTEQRQYETFASELIELRDECQRVDKAVRSKVSSLTATFKDNHGIRNSAIENAINYFVTDLSNDTAFGRWLSDKGDQFKEGSDYLKSSIKEWYNYEGGKELIQGALVAILEIAIAAIGIFSGASFLALLAACIAMAGGVVNLINEIRAYDQTHNNNDPARGRRTSEINSVQDLLRTSDDKGLHTLAAGIDLVNLVCGISAVISSVGTLLKKGYKWATGSIDDITKIEWKNVFSKSTFEKFKIKFVNYRKQIQIGFKLDGWDFAKKLSLDFGSDFMNNLKTYYVGNGSSSVKNSLSLTKDIIKGEGVVKIAFKNILAPSISTGDIVNIGMEGNGQLKLDFDSIKLKDFYNIYDNISSKVVKNDLFASGENDINRTVMSKLSEITDINISIPDIYVPDIEMPVLRTA